MLPSDVAVIKISISVKCSRHRDTGPTNPSLQLSNYSLTGQSFHVDCCRFYMLFTYDITLESHQVKKVCILPMFYLYFTCTLFGIIALLDSSQVFFLLYIYLSFTYSFLYTSVILQHYWAVQRCCFIYYSTFTCIHLQYCSTISLSSGVGSAVHFNCLLPIFYLFTPIISQSCSTVLRCYFSVYFNCL